MQPAKPAQVVYGACHVVTKRRAHGVEPLRIAKLENGNTGLSVDAETNECAEVCAALTNTRRLKIARARKDDAALHLTVGDESVQGARGQRARDEGAAIR